VFDVGAGLSSGSGNALSRFVHISSSEADVAEEVSSARRNPCFRYESARSEVLMASEEVEASEVVQDLVDER